MMRWRRVNRDTFNARATEATDLEAVGAVAGLCFAVVSGFSGTGRHRRDLVCALMKICFLSVRIWTPL
jgi:hypothetical protein